MSVTIDGAKALLIVHVVDCAGNSVAGAQITATPSGTTKYIANGRPSSTDTVTDSSGVAFIFNVPAGAVTLSATVGSATFRSRMIRMPLQTRRDVSVGQMRTSMTTSPSKVKSLVG